MPNNEVLSAEDVQALQPMYAAVIAAIKEVYDPEIPVNVYDLGLIYELTISKAHEVYILMTFTAPNCPMADQVLAGRHQMHYRAHFRARMGPLHALRRSPRGTWAGL